jgi:hypothetical protein
MRNTGDVMRQQRTSAAGHNCSSTLKSVPDHIRHLCTNLPHLLELAHSSGLQTVKSMIEGA